ncbi:MAG: ABC transporter substrate-binding protein [candidate division NC10 bacterium]|nr:ABC transporter substrate-binding protein [candidate division NC10 bacterium]
MKSARVMSVFWGVMLPFFFLVADCPYARAGEPTDLLKQTTDRVLEILRDPKLKEKSRIAERRRLLRKIADERFDWEEMAKRSLAIHWAERTPEEKKEFVALFSDLLERSYMGKIESYKDEKVLFVGEKIDGDYATVETQIVTQREVEVPIHYRLRKKGNEWFIYDVSIEGVSLVNNYRTQFNRILSSSSFAELIKRMKVKQIQEAIPPSPSN